MKTKIKKFNESELIDTSDFINKKLKLYKDTLSLFLRELPSDKIILHYLTEDDGYIQLQDYIGMNLKGEIKWSTSIGIIEACDLIIDEAFSNGNV